MSDYFEIAYALASKRLCLFTGTGFSISITKNKAPKWQELLEQVCDTHFGTDDVKLSLFPRDGKGKATPSKNPLSLEEAAQVIDLELRQKDLNIHEAVANQLEGLKPNGNFEHTRKFFENESFIVATTNYDKLAEQLAGSDVVSITPGLPVPRSSWRVKVHHVHGSTEVPSRMVVTSDDYFSFMHTESYHSQKLSTVFHENTVVILGYSLGDTNLKVIMNAYRNYARSHNVGGSIFFVSRSPVDRVVADYYSHCYGIRVISGMEIEEFFEKLSPDIERAKQRLAKSKKNIQAVLGNGRSFKEVYVKSEQSFYEFISATRGAGIALDTDRVTEVIEQFLDKKLELCRVRDAWEQYTHLARWLCYLGSFLDVGETSTKDAFLRASMYSMQHMSEKKRLGYSWQAYQEWSSKWRSLKSENRKLISDYIEENSTNPDALRVISQP